MLPSDDSVESREGRTAYRAKAVAIFRESSEEGWLLLDQAPVPVPDSKSKTVKKAEANAWVRQTLCSHYATDTKSSQVGVIFSIISNFIASNPTVEHKYYLSDVDFKFDTNAKIFTPTVRVSSFTVHEKPVDGDEDSVALSIDMLDAVYYLDRPAWHDASAGAQDMIAAGNKIRQEMTLDLLI